MKKLFGFLALFVTIFTSGFLVHAFIFPDVLSQTPNFEFTKQKVLGQNNKRIPDSTEINKSLTISTFKDGKFSPSKVFIKQGYYVLLRNGDENDFMWLLSEDKDLTTVRNYGLGEEVRKRMDIKGEFIVYEKNTKASVVIVVN